MLKAAKRSLVTLCAVTALAGAVRPAGAQGILAKDGEKIAFLGDSITEGGQGSPLGYVRLVISGLAANGVKTEMIGAGKSGHKSNDMLGRLQHDVIDKMPNWMTLSCGVNDVWHGATGVPLDKYKENITAIVDKATAANIKVVILTSTMIGEDQPNGNNQKLIAYNDFLKALAAERKLPLADLNADMQAAIAAAGPHQGNLLTGDGVHMNVAGNQMMAAGVLKAFGLSDAQLQKAKDFWLDMPDAIEAGNRIKLSQRQYNQLKAYADKQKKSVDAVINDELAKVLAMLLKTAATP